LALVVGGLCSAARHVIVDPQGQWFGRLPLDGADDCRIRLLPTGNFDFECRAAEKYAAQGAWVREGNVLRMTFAWFARDGQKTKTPEPWELRMDGVRNALCVGTPADRGEPYCWQRATP